MPTSPSIVMSLGVEWAWCCTEGYFRQLYVEKQVILLIEIVLHGSTHDDMCFRFDEIMRNLHFTDNKDPRNATDRAWKVRSVVDCLQKTFKKNYTTPTIISFDEGMLPSRSPYNKCRQYLKDKPHKWGTKIFLTCDATTAYCVR